MRLKYTIDYKNLPSDGFHLRQGSPLAYVMRVSNAPLQCHTSSSNAWATGHSLCRCALHVPKRVLAAWDLFSHLSNDPWIPSQGKTCVTPGRGGISPLKTYPHLMQNLRTLLFLRYEHNSPARFGNVTDCVVELFPYAILNLFYMVFFAFIYARSTKRCNEGELPPSIRLTI